ncbi:hypothetical protein GIB67_022709 [Kingdonia uniflora]|uniref:GDSL esterase/lipase n=1 Tax=Kingdonia uniflora TaxID=39325 RepID=A0A7J7P8F7_9MAGN|nr:hypothetical protein GIB67_022709 [Kingdonia uniflora]
MMRVVLILVLFLAMTLIVSTTPGKVNLLTLQKLALRNNLTYILVFGDSSVDPENNNRLLMTFKGNFEPYGKNFFNGRPTRKFDNGRLPTDFIAEAIGFTKIIPGFLDLHLKKENLLHGVSFAFAASGYDELTANLTNVLFVSKQLAYLKHYKLASKRIVGQTKAEEIINNAIIVMNMGTNDFIQNYYLVPIRSKEFNVQQYTDYLIKCMTKDIKQCGGGIAGNEWGDHCCSREGESTLMASNYEKLGVKGEKQEELLPPLSPLSRCLNSSTIPLTILAVFEFEVPVQESHCLEFLEYHFVPCTPHFSSVIDTDSKGVE